MVSRNPRLRAEQIGPEGAESFDHFIESFAHADITQSFGWGEVKRKAGWTPIRLILTDEQGRIRAAVSVLRHRFPLGRCFLYVPRGPVLDYSDLPTMTAAYRELAELARREGAVFLKVDPPVLRSEADVLWFLKDQHFRRARERRHWGGVQPVAVYRLPLSGSEQEIFGRFHPKTRYNVRLAERKGVRVRLGGRGDLPRFYGILQETSERQGFGIRSLSYFYDLWDTFVPAGRIELLLGEANGDALAGALVASFGSTAVYLYGGSRNRQRQLMPAYAVQWQAIRRAIARGSKIYDFLGVSKEMDSTDPLFGLYRFKRGFRPVYTEWLGEFDLPLAPALYRFWNVAEPAYLKSVSRVGRVKRYARSHWKPLRSAARSRNEDSSADAE